MLFDNLFLCIVDNILSGNVIIIVINIVIFVSLKVVGKVFNNKFNIGLLYL